MDYLHQVVLIAMCVGVFLLGIAFLLDNSYIKAAICIVWSLLFAYCNYSMTHKNFEDLRYETYTQAVQETIKVNEVIKEKGKEPQYVIYCSNYGTITIPETIYKAYIGEENNAITVQETGVYIYVGHTYPFGEETSFNGEENQLPFILRHKHSLPWEENVKPYSEDEIKELANQYLDGEIDTNGSTSHNYDNEDLQTID